MKKISNSELQTWKECKRHWWLRYYHRLRQKKDGIGALSIGNMVHHVLEVYYTDDHRDPETFWETRGVAILAAYVQERQNDPRLPVDLHASMLDDFELAKIMLKGYFEDLVAEGFDSEFRITSAEEEVEVFLGKILGDDVWLIAKLDAEIEMKSTGQRAFMDHKSVQALADLPKQIGRNEQLRMYGLLQRMKAMAEGNGQQIFANGGVLNMLRKVKRSSRANPPFYGRAGVTHNDDVYRNFHARVFGEVFNLLTDKARLDAGMNHHQVVYPTPSRDCDWKCPFASVCTMFDDGSDVDVVIAERFEQHDPYERYTELEKG